MPKKKKKVIVAISGGVDSSTSAFLLQKKGYEIIGVFMRLNQNSDEAENNARLVCNKLGIKFYPINLKYNFKRNIIDYFLDSYAQGLTPNPCVECNRLIKFGELLEFAKKLGADFIATGHYIQKKETKDKSGNITYKLFKGKDMTKDQSYFLYNLTQKDLSYILFPLGKYEKQEIKKIAEKEEIAFSKAESQDICFLKGDHNDFLKDNLKIKPGNILDQDGKKVGRHQGLPLYTIGQRKGIEIGGIGPFYVSGFDYAKNILYVTNKADDEALHTGELIAGDCNFIRKLDLPLDCQAVIRYRQKAVECTIQKQKAKDKYKVVFKEKQRAVTPGQSVVFYKKDELLGGGIIYE